MPKTTYMLQPVRERALSSCNCKERGCGPVRWRLPRLVIAAFVGCLGDVQSPTGFRRLITENHRTRAERRGVLHSNPTRQIDYRSSTESAAVSCRKDRPRTRRKGGMALFGGRRLCLACLSSRCRPLSPIVRAMFEERARFLALPQSGQPMVGGQTD